MMGLIWFVQVVHYPLFHQVAAPEFVVYERIHQRLTSLVVGPLMGAEGALAVVLFVAPPDDLGRALPLVGLGLLAMVHASTILLQVPAHDRLADGKTDDTIRRLVLTNWIRTIGWSARTVVAAAMILVVS